MVLELSKTMYLLQLFVDVNRKYKAVIAIYVYASESSCFTILEDGVGYDTMTKSLEDISF